jgi:putative iron-only hydrogenase system regulator
MEKRIGTALILIEDKSIVHKLNQVLSLHSDIIIARQGLSLREKGYSLISLVLEGTTDEMGSLTGQLGRISGVQVKSALIKPKQDNEKN